MPAVNVNTAHEPGCRDLQTWTLQTAESWGTRANITFLLSAYATIVGVAGAARMAKDNSDLISKKRYNRLWEEYREGQFCSTRWNMLLMCNTICGAWTAFQAIRWYEVTIGIRERKSRVLLETVRDEVEACRARLQIRSRHSLQVTRFACFT